MLNFFPGVDTSQFSGLASFRTRYGKFLCISTPATSASFSMFYPIIRAIPLPISHLSAKKVVTSKVKQSSWSMVASLLSSTRLYYGSVWINVQSFHIIEKPTVKIVFIYPKMILNSNLNHYIKRRQ